MRSILVVQFFDADRATRAVRQVCSLDSVAVRAAAVIRRDGGGGWTVTHRYAPPPFGATCVGGAAGMVAGAPWGTVTLATAGLAGLLAGAVIDLFISAERTAIIAAMADRVPPCSAAIVAEVDEPGVGPVDDVMHSLAGSVIRLDRWRLRAVIMAGGRPEPEMQ